ncbi:hypothetical protein [Winogradskyella sp. 4-2091]|uniref:hypothetical protein n=1 Tax=Winogradskyella sp. 4-2091 TaxID=3381659 RepID=UPI0038928A10
MFKNLFSKNEYSSKTGFFKVENKELIPIDELEIGSINNCIEKIGFPTNHIYTIHSFDSDKISVLGFKTLTKKLEFVLAENKSKISFSDVSKAVKGIDWDFEYSDLNIEDILQEGIDYENFDLNFVKSIMNLTKEDKELYKSEKLGLYLQFENEILKAFTSSEWENSSTKWLKEINEPMVESMVKEAKQFHRNEIEAMEEVNRQTKALMNVPEAMKNEFLSLHENRNGNFNFHNLVIAHYSQECNQDDFLFMNKGRFNKIDESVFEVGKFKYEFDNSRELIAVYEK